MKKIFLLLISCLPFFAFAQKKNKALEKTGNSITADAKKRARLIFFTAMEIANRDEMLRRDIPLDTQQSY